jgi:ribosomal protein S6
MSVLAPEAGAEARNESLKAQAVKELAEAVKVLNRAQYYLDRLNRENPDDISAFNRARRFRMAVEEVAEVRQHFV